jgi:hypothetical protein
MLDGVNDQEEHAHQLGKLLETFKAVRHYHITAFLSLLPCSSSFLLVTSLYQMSNTNFAVVNF